MAQVSALVQVLALEVQTMSTHPLRLLSPPVSRSSRVSFRYRRPSAERVAELDDSRCVHTNGGTQGQWWWLRKKGLADTVSP